VIASKNRAINLDCQTAEIDGRIVRKVTRASLFFISVMIESDT
jgi:hypothetical protein